MILSYEQASTVMALISFADNESCTNECDWLLALELCRAYPQLANDYSELMKEVNTSIAFCQKRDAANKAHMKMVQEGIDRRKT